MMKVIRKTRGALTLSVLVVVAAFFWGRPAPVARAADNFWTAEYWNNRTLSGTPVLTRQEANLNYDWGKNAPDPLINAEQFSARWTRSVFFNAGMYRFTVTTDDGMRLWVDNILLIDSWWDSQVHSLSNDIFLSAGDHLIRVEYYEAGGDAVAKLAWSSIGPGGPSPSTHWRGEYYNNMTLSGAPVLVRDDAVINFDFGTGSPGAGVPADRFSARWTRVVDLAPGLYQFTVIVDDGVRLWVNGQLVLDKWFDSLNGTYIFNLDMPGGAVPMTMEYFENQGGATAKMIWVRQPGGPGIANWRGEYFNNRTLSGAPVLTRDDNQLIFDWREGSPAPGIVPADDFSVRWTRSLSFIPGRYRFTVTADDGVRLWVNNRLLVDAWRDQLPSTFVADIDLAGGSVPLRVEFYDHTGGARISLSWARVDNLPPAQPPPAAGFGTVLSQNLNVRTGPGLQFGILGTRAQGQRVDLTGFRSETGTWVQIHWNGGTAWVSAHPSLLQTSIPVANMPIRSVTFTIPTSPTGEPMAVVAFVQYLNLRSGPGTTFTVLTVKPAGTAVTMIGRNSSTGWIKVRLADGTVGWMGASYLMSNVAKSTLPIVN